MQMDLETSYAFLGPFPSSRGGLLLACLLLHFFSSNFGLFLALSRKKMTKLPLHAFSLNFLLLATVECFSSLPVQQHKLIRTRLLL
jgi:hypothetical protein